MAIPKDGRVYKMEKIDGQLYRVMYYKGKDGRMIRSKYPQKVNEKQPTMKKQPMKKQKQMKPMQQIKQQQQQQIKQQQPAPPMNGQEQMIDDYGPNNLARITGQMSQSVMYSGSPRSMASENLMNAYANLGKRRVY